MFAMLQNALAIMFNFFGCSNKDICHKELMIKLKHPFLTAYLIFLLISSSSSDHITQGRFQCIREAFLSEILLMLL